MELSEVKYSALNLTHNCNLRCSYCYAGPKHQRSMSLRTALQSIDFLAGQSKGRCTITLFGGEPLLEFGLIRQLVEYSQKTYDSKIAFRMSSNGTLITPEVSRRLKESRIESVQVSLEGLESTHDHIRGHGSFGRAVAGIKELLSARVSTHVNLTLSRLNAAELEALAQFAGELGVDRVTYSRLVACGSGTGLAGEMLTPEELAALHRQLRKRGVGGTRISSRDPLSLVAGWEGDVPQGDFPVGGCAAGVFGVTIASDGGIMPCRRMGLVIGNIRTDSLRRLWIESPVLAALRERHAYHGGCDSCRYWAVCRGCRAVALAASRARGGEDYLGPDPECPYRSPS